MRENFVSVICFWIIRKVINLVHETAKLADASWPYPDAKASLNPVSSPALGRHQTWLWEHSEPEWRRTALLFLGEPRPTAPAHLHRLRNGFRLRGQHPLCSPEALILLGLTETRNGPQALSTQWHCIRGDTSDLCYGLLLEAKNSSAWG